jgi:hypothetical protein
MSQRGQFRVGWKSLGRPGHAQGCARGGRLGREDVLELRKQLTLASNEARELARQLTVAINTDKLVPEDPRFVFP